MDAELKTPCFMSVVAKKKMPEDWEPFKFESIQNGVLVTGGIGNPTTRGKYKGRIRYEKPHTQVFVSDREIIQEHAEYCSQNNYCYACCGRGAEWIGWSKAEGNKFKPCKVCDGQGSPFKGIGK